MARRAHLGGPAEDQARLPDGFQHALRRQPLELDRSPPAGLVATASRPEATGLPVIIADGLIGRDKQEPRSAQARTASSKIASAILDSDALVGLTHVTGHVQTGLGAAIKNIGMGCASRAGKLDQHSVTHPRVNAKQCRNCSVCMAFCPEAAIVQAEGHVVIDPAKCIGCGECLVVCKFGAIKMKWDEDSARLQEKMAEYALRVADHFKGKAAFVSFLIQVTKDCDCMAKNQKPIVEDIGILASLDPVAIDQATADLLVERRRRDRIRCGPDTTSIGRPSSPTARGSDWGRGSTTWSRSADPRPRARPQAWRRRCGMKTASAAAAPSITPAPMRTVACWPMRSAVTPTASVPRGIRPKKTRV